MDYTLIFWLLIGIGFIIWGSKITFTKNGLDWMYKSGIWKKGEPLFTEKGERRFDRIRGAGLLIFGIIVVVMILATFFIKPYGI